VFHAPFIAAESQMELAYVVTSRREKQVEVRERYPEVVVMASFAELVEMLDRVDLVVVSTPNSTHVPLAEALLRRGCHVVVDKPVAPTNEQVRYLLGLARSAGRHLVPFQNRRWDGDFQTVRGLLQAGTLGAVHRLESRYERWQPVVPSGPERAWKRDGSTGQATGILYDLGTHLIDQAVALFGRPGSVYAEIETRRGGAAVDDDVFVALSYPGGPEVHLWASAVAADQAPRFRVLGDLGAFVKFGMDVQEAALMAGHLPTEPGWGEEPPESWGVLTTTDGRREEPTLSGAYQLFYSGLAGCLIDGTPPPVDPEDAVLTAAIIEAAQRSAARQQTVLL
jgi:predicted dehydrogenase